MSVMAIKELSDEVEAAVQSAFPFAKWYVSVSLFCVTSPCIHVLGIDYEREDLAEVEVFFTDENPLEIVISGVAGMLQNKVGSIGNAYREQLAKQEAAALESWIPAMERKRKDGRL